MCQFTLLTRSHGDDAGKPRWGFPSGSVVKNHLPMQETHASLRVEQGIWGIPSRLSQKAFPLRLSHMGCPTCHSGVSRSWA